MVIFGTFQRQNLIQIYTKLHHLKNFLGGTYAPKPPSKARRYFAPPNASRQRDVYLSPIISPHVCTWIYALDCISISGGEGGG